MPADALSVDISESLLRTERPDVESKLAVLRETGVRVALDDFGTGSAALASLSRLGIDYLKIDSGIVAKVQEHSSEHVLCQAIVAMAHKMGIKVIAEGVECEQQHLLLQAAGCDMAQGYWYARPASVDEFERWYLSANARTRALGAVGTPVVVEPAGADGRR